MDDSPRFRSAGYSSEVRLSLVVEGKTLRLAQIGRDAITLHEPTELPLCEAQIVMAVDGDEERWNVFLTNGATPPDKRVAIHNRQPVELETARAG